MAGKKGFFSGILKRIGSCHVSEIFYLLKDFAQGKLHN